jgi:hypothetical protein
MVPTRLPSSALTASGLAQEKGKRSQSGYRILVSAVGLSPQHAGEHPKDSLSNQLEITFYIRFDNGLPEHVTYTISKDFATFLLNSSSR